VVSSDLALDFQDPGVTARADDLDPLIHSNDIKGRKSAPALALQWLGEPRCNSLDLGHVILTLNQ
jgi:hypothetical protein